MKKIAKAVFAVVAVTMLPPPPLHAQPRIEQPALVARVTGKLAYRERIALPPSTRVEVVVSSIGRDGQSQQVVGRSVRTLTNATPPIPFAVDVSRDRLPAGPLFGLRAFIYDTNGRQLFRTGTPVLVDVRARGFDTGTIMLTMTASGGEGSAGVPGLSNINWIVGQIGPVRTANPRPTLRFDLRGGVSGNGGCNSFSGRFTLDGQRLSIDPGGTTLRMCEQRVMRQETRFLRLLADVTSVRIDRLGRLTMVTRSAGTITARRQGGRV